jgi:hypothetical protein
MFSLLCSLHDKTLETVILEELEIQNTLQKNCVNDIYFKETVLVENDGFLRKIKMRSMTFFGEVKPAVACRKILLYIKDPYSIKEILVGNIHGHFPQRSLLCYWVSLLVTDRKPQWLNQE